MADETPSHQPENPERVLDAERGTSAAQASRQSASGLGASMEALGGAHPSSPHQGACLVHSTSKASVQRAADYAAFNGVAGSQSSSSNSRTPSPSTQQGNPGLGLTPAGHGARVKWHISHPRSHTGMENPAMTHEQSYSLHQANPSSHGLPRGSSSMMASMPPALVPVSSDFAIGSPSEEAKVFTEGSKLKNSCDEKSKPAKAAIRGKLIVEKTDSSFGGKGEMADLDVFTVLPNYEVIWRRTPTTPNDDAEDKSEADKEDDLREITGRNHTSEDNERGCGSDDELEDTETENQPDVRLIHDVVDKLTQEFNLQVILEGPSVSQYPCRTFSQRSTSQNEAPKRTQSSPLDAGDKHDCVSTQYNKIKTVALRRCVSTTLPKPSLPDEYSDKESSIDETSEEESPPDETSEEGVSDKESSSDETGEEASPHDETSEEGLDLQRLLTACAVLETVTAVVSNEAHRFSESQSATSSRQNAPMNPMAGVHAGDDDKDEVTLQKEVERTGEENGNIFRHTLGSYNSVKAATKSREFAGDTMYDPRSLSKRSISGNSKKATKIAKALLLPRRKYSITSYKRRKQATASNNGDGGIPLGARLATQISRQRRTKPLCAFQPPHAKLRQTNCEFISEQRPNESGVRRRTRSHVEKAPGEVFIHVKAQNDLAKKWSTDGGSTKRALNTDEYCDSNETITATRITPLGRASFRHVKRKVGPPVFEKDVNRKLRKTSQIGGLSSSHSGKRVGNNRARYKPRAAVRRHNTGSSLGAFGTSVPAESDGRVESVAVPSTADTLTSTRGSAPWPRNSSRSPSREFERRSGKSCNSGTISARGGKRRTVRSGLPSAQQRWGYLQRARERDSPTPHSTTPLPATRMRPAPVVYKKRFKTQLYASFSPPPPPIWSPLPQCLIRPPICSDAVALANEPNLLDSYPCRPPFLTHGTLSARFQEDVCASKPTQVTAAEPGLPQLAPPKPELRDTNKEPPASPSSFQTTFDAAKQQHSLRSVEVILPDAAIVTPSALRTVPSVSSYSAGVQQPHPDGAQGTSAHLCFPLAQQSPSPSSCDNDPIGQVNVNPFPAVQRHDVTAPAKSCRRSYSNPLTSHNFAGPSGFPNDLEGENGVEDARSTDSMVTSDENRLHGKDVEAIFRRCVSVPKVIVLICLFAGIAACFIVPAINHQPMAATESEEEDGEPSWLFSPLSSIHSAPTANHSSCQGHLCREHVGALLHTVDSNVLPCQNFYGHVCARRAVNGTADEQLAQQSTLWVLSFLRDTAGGELPLVVASRHLWNDCVQLTTLIRKDKAPLLALLNLTGLSSWPYDKNTSLPDVWKVAGDLERLMALAPLVELKGLANQKAQLVPGDLGASDDAGDVLNAMLTLRPSGSHLRALAEDVAGLSLRLKNVRHHRPTLALPEGKDAEVLPRPYLKAVLSGLVLDVGAVDIHPEPLIRSLVQIVRDSGPLTVLNLLGYRLVRHVELFTPPVANADIQSGASLSRESRCTRAVLNDALSNDEAQYLRYAAVRKHVNFDLVRSLLAGVKRALDVQLAGQRWLDLPTRRSIRRRLAEIKVRFSFDHYESSMEGRPASGTLALPSEALATYQRFRESRFRDLLLRGAAYDEDQDCAYDHRKKVLLLRLSVVELRDPQSPLWPVLQAARLGPRLSRCLLRVLLPSPTDREAHAAVHWSPAMHTRLHGLRACMRAQHALRSKATESGWSPEQEALSVVDNAALGPSIYVFREYVERLVSKDPAAVSANDVAMTNSEWDQVFYLAYVQSMCESPDHGRSLARHTPHWETVISQLSNDEAFQRAFQCRAGDSMRLDTTCSFWEASNQTANSVST